MRKVVILGVVMVLSLGLGSNLFAAGFPPKTLCLDWEGARDIAFVLKSQGTISTTTAKVKMFSINGVHDPGGSTETSIVGTGYIGTDGKFHFSYYGQQLMEISGANNWLLTAKGTVDPSTTPATGTLIFDWLDTSPTGTPGAHWDGPLTVIDCHTEIVAPQIIQGDGDLPGGTNK